MIKICDFPFQIFQDTINIEHNGDNMGSCVATCVTHYDKDIWKRVWGWNVGH